MENNINEKLYTLIRDNQVKYFKIAMSYMKNKEDALDVLHNAIVKAIKNCRQLKKIQYMDTWFCRILINECLAFKKKKEKEVAVEYIESFEKNENFEDRYENIIVLSEAIDKLEANLKNIIILRYFNNMKIAEIAEITNTNLNTVKSRLYKALDILKKEMEVELYE